ncbi:antibiotic biosynthesis monooxygenase family protein [Sphingomonas sp.]|uniref:antibiotic biosynthesis monooxygenase family protein n=1 Tax=Sphingomonas sp. TaxID=28214 RepID=UPI0025F213A0|nr:antibiotic biosynthesis monooxygenase family protein [Sphingomonas sp.]MBV9529070.1 antibiotic biosynthesis monooxygenase [Sphingomonas sp.]
MTVKLINVFQMPEEQEDEFLKRWNETTQHYARTEGFIETHLHRNTGVGNQTFSFVNIALWASAEAFTNAHKGYVPGEESIPGISFHPAIFEEVVMTTNLLSQRSKGAE